MLPRSAVDSLGLYFYMSGRAWLMVRWIGMREGERKGCFVVGLWGVSKGCRSGMYVKSCYLWPLLSTRHFNRNVFHSDFLDQLLCEFLSSAALFAWSGKSPV